MANASPGPEQDPQQQPEGPRIITWVIGFLVAALLLFAMFFTWYENTKGISPDPSKGGNSPFTFGGTN